MGELRTLLKNALLKSNVKDDVALFYSGGYESFTSLIACFDCGIIPTLYTFYVKGVDSSDLTKARYDADYFELKLVEVELPNDIESLKRDVYDIIRKTHCARKTVVQCMQPIYYTLDKIKERNVMIGLERGQIWGLNRKGSIAGRKGLEAFNEYRKKQLEDDQFNSTHYICEEISKKHNLIRLYDDDDVYNWFMSKDYNTLNYPKPKQIIIDEYKDILAQMVCQPKKVNYQIESGIRELHESLLQDKQLNPNNVHKAVVGIYNKILKDIDNAQIQLPLEFD